MKQNSKTTPIMSERDVVSILKLANRSLKDPQNYHVYIHLIMNTCINNLPL